MRLWKKFLIVGVVLSVTGCILLPISQIRTEIRRNAEAPMTYRIVRAPGEPTTFIVLPYDAYPYSWLMLPATVILTIGTVSTIYSYLVKRTYG